MKRKSLMLFSVAISLLFSSCFGTKTAVGHYRELVKVEKTDTYNYSKGKQAYLFWGFLPLGRTQIATPPHGNCQVKTRVGFLDMTLTLVTGGLFTMQTIKVKAPKVMDSTYSEAIILPDGAVYEIESEMVEVAETNETE